MPSSALAGPPPAVSVSCPPPSSPAVLAWLDPFVERILPGLVRRLARWKGVPLRRDHDWHADLQQELVVDCLEHQDTIAGLTEAERHQRWFRLVERHLYRHRLRDARRAEVESDVNLIPDPAMVDPASGFRGMQDLPPARRALLRQLLAANTRLGNGRCNMTATSRASGTTRYEVRRLWTDLADALGFDDAYLAFWQRRLAEAALGLAADLLRDTGALRILGERQRRRPDPKGRRRRIRRIQRALLVRPLPSSLRQAMRGILRASRGGPARAGELIQAAARLAPDHPAVPLWRFEAAIASGDLAGAAAALRTARVTAADRVPVILARARLLEARGRDRAALRLLSRSLVRCHRDGRLLAALRAASPATPA